MKEKELKETIFDQSLDLIRSYQAVDLEITLLEARDTYTPEEVARQRKENLDRRNLSRGTTNDTAFRVAISTIVEDQRAK